VPKSAPVLPGRSPRVQVHRDREQPLACWRRRRWLLEGGRATLPLHRLGEEAPGGLTKGEFDARLGGSSVTVVEMITPGGSADSTVSVAEVSATTGRQLRVRYRVDTGDGFLYRFFSSDPSGRYLLLDVGPASGTANGWIDDGRLVQLTPANGTSIFHEAW
jgi:hypothetical protein